jgi:electron transfer flavoprotein alpha subunit
VSGILIIAEHRRGELRVATLELVSAAQAVKRNNDTIAVALIADEPERLIPHVSVFGVDEVVTVKIPSHDFDPDAIEAAVGALITARKPSLVLIPHSIDSFGYAAAVAAKGGFGFATDVFKLDYQQFVGSEAPGTAGESGAAGAAGLVATRGGYGQKVNVEVDFPGKEVVLLALRANTYKPAEGAASPAVTSSPAPAMRARVSSRSFIEVSSGDDVDMTMAEFVLSIGRGIGEQANVERFRELAAAVGATLGCSRPIADAGWLPKSRQVGQSGKTASACKLYLAMGISGAIQHLAGMKHVSTIVAVNADQNASIFSVARYGIVGDIFEVADALRTHFPGQAKEPTQ